MLRYGKLARQAVSVISYLAEKYQPDAVAISSSEIGRVRKIPAALAAKLLSQASTAGLVRGSTGPGGGYRLAKPPAEIRLSEIVALFGRSQEESLCPYSLDWCGSGQPCPLHEGFAKLKEDARAFLEGTTLAVFLKTSSHPDPESPHQA
jgi:Rrf2 family iron-sulfur cluster assembly transcriptional regulator